MSFLVYRVEESESGMQAAWQEVEPGYLPEEEVLIDVHYSSVNYKDALSASGNKGVSKNFPHTPGIDAAGVVIQSASADFSAGDEVIVTGYDLGMNTKGGFGQRIAVPASWIVKKPKNLSLATAMAWGTAGFTAAISVQKLERAGIKPEQGPILVTGATGGVGSIAVALLAKLGYQVIAVTGKAEQATFLKSLGAHSVIDREAVFAFKDKIMAKPLYQGVIDTVGGEMVSALVGQIQLEGAISTCGMIAGNRIEASVFPFILRGVSLLGIESAEFPLAGKRLIWDKIANDWALPDIEQQVTEIGRGELAATLQKLLAGRGIGRYRLNLQKA